MRYDSLYGANCMTAQKFDGVDKINLKVVERESELNYGVVSCWVRGKVDRADFPVIEAWCRYFGVKPGDILTLED